MDERKPTIENETTECPARVLTGTVLAKNIPAVLLFEVIDVASFFSNAGSPEFVEHVTNCRKCLAAVVSSRFEK